MLEFLNHPSNLQPAKSSAKFGEHEMTLKMNSLTPPAPGRFPWSGFPAFICGKHHRHSRCPWKKPCIPTVCRWQPPGQKIPACREILLTTHLVFLSTFQGNKILSSNHFFPFTQACDLDSLNALIHSLKFTVANSEQHMIYSTLQQQQSGNK